jgi:hypothetical protein
MASFAGRAPAPSRPTITRMDSPTPPPTRLLPNLRTDGFCQGRPGVYMNYARLTGGGCPAVTDGLDRFRESNTLLRWVGGRPPTFPPASAARSGISPIPYCQLGNLRNSRLQHDPQRRSPWSPPTWATDGAETVVPGPATCSWFHCCEPMGCQ